MKNPGIYILKSPSGKQYVGKDRHLPKRATQHLRGKEPTCPRIHNAIKKYGANTFSLQIIQYPGISQEALNAVERWWIRRLQTLSPSGYNLTEGGEGVIPSEETRQKISKKASKRVEEGTHNLLGANNPSHKRIADGTHPFLDSEIQRRAQIKRDAVNKKRLEEGTHNFLDSDFQRRNNQKRIKEGTHNLLGKKNPSHKRVTDGTHNFLGDSNPMKQRSKNGTHHFLGSDFQRRRVKDGTHNFLGSSQNRKRLEDGTHHFLGENHPMRRLAKEGRHPQTRKRQKAEWCYIIALSRYWYEIHDYTLKRRAEFLSKDIPDTSNTEQEYLF